jgi:hypothetical protein
MKASDAEKNGDRCPNCNGRTTKDLKNKRWVSHIERNRVGPDVPRSPKTHLCRYGHGEKDLV